MMKKDLDSYLLTKQELQIMKIVWKRGIVTVREVFDILSSTKSTAHTTILTLMQILDRKGVLARRLIGRTHHYSAVFSKHKTIQNRINDLLERYFNGDLNKLIATILENEYQSGKSTAELASRKHSQLNMEKSLISSHYSTL